MHRTTFAIINFSGRSEVKLENEKKICNNCGKILYHSSSIGGGNKLTKINKTYIEMETLYFHAERNKIDEKINNAHFCNTDCINGFMFNRNLEKK